MKISFLGFGEAAFCIASGWRDEGYPVQVSAYDALLQNPDKSALLVERAKQADVVLVASPEQAILGAELIIAAVPSSYTLALCQSVLPFLRPGQLYADVSASTPDTKKKEWALLEPVGILFVDAAMLGSLPQSRHKVPITASGNGAQRFKETVTPLGMKVAVAGDRAGDASAIKLIRSVYMKGTAALMLEMSTAAQRFGVLEPVVTSIGKSLDNIPFEQHLTRIMLGTAIHAHRRAAELGGSVQMCREANIPCWMSDAAILWHNRTAEYDLSARYQVKKPADWREIVGDMVRPAEKV